MQTRTLRRFLAVVSVPWLAGLALGQEPADAVPDPVYRALPSVVAIGGGGGLVGDASGNGFFVDDTGVIATDLNLVKGAEYVSVRDHFGDVAYFPRIVGFDEASDLVLLRSHGHPRARPERRPANRRLPRDYGAAAGRGVSPGGHHGRVSESARRLPAARPDPWSRRTDACRRAA